MTSTEKAALPPPSPQHSCRGRIVSANFLDRFRAILLALLLAASFAAPALAGPFEDAVAKFANDDFSDTDEAIGAVAASGNPLAFPIISALQDGRLSADPDTKKVFVTGADGKVIDAATGAALDHKPNPVIVTLQPVAPPARRPPRPPRRAPTPQS